MIPIVHIALLLALQTSPGDIQIESLKHENQILKQRIVQLEYESRSVDTVEPIIENGKSSCPDPDYELKYTTVKKNVCSGWKTIQNEDGDCGTLQVQTDCEDKNVFVQVCKRK